MPGEGTNLQRRAGSDFAFRRGHQPGDGLVTFGEHHLMAGLNSLHQLGKPAVDFIHFRTRGHA